jgi:signal transduction histidine kinase
MRERVAAVGGELTVGPEGEQDWLVRLRLPVSDQPVMDAR